jgi:hypothetical protein
VPSLITLAGGTSTSVPPVARPSVQNALVLYEYCAAVRRGGSRNLLPSAGIPFFASLRRDLDRGLVASDGQVVKCFAVIDITIERAEINAAARIDSCVYAAWVDEE